MKTSRAGQTKRKTRIQAEKEEKILEAALDVFSTYGFRGATLDQIADVADLSKPNLLYYYSTKEDIHRALLDRIVEKWKDSLLTIDPNGNPLAELRAYIRHKMQMAKDYPRESRLFASEVLEGAPRFQEEIRRKKVEFDAHTAIIQKWIDDGKIASVDPQHLLFSIWATTQHYADFDIQVRIMLGKVGEGEGRFDDAARTLETMFIDGLKPRS